MTAKPSPTVLIGIATAVILTFAGAWAAYHYGYESLGYALFAIPIVVLMAG